MKVIVHPDGEVTFETDDVDQALAMVKSLRNGTKPPKKPRPKKEAMVQDVPLSAQLAQTWEWLVAHDREEGVHNTEVAAGLGLQDAAANWRLSQLIKKELAYRVKPGRYRPGSP